MTSTTEISTAGREAAEAVDSVARTRVDQAMTECVAARLGRADITARAFSECGVIIIGWVGPAVAWDTDEESTQIHQARAERAALTEALAAAGYTVTGSDTTRTFLGRVEVRHGAAVAVAITPQG